MTTPQILHWDSNFFGITIGEAVLNTNETEIHGDGFDMIKTVQEHEFKVKIDDFKETFAETKIIFEKKLNPQSFSFDEKILDTDQDPRPWQDFRELSYESGKYSRFRLDTNFNEEKFRKLYDEWIINSLNKTFAAKVFFIEKDNDPAAFVTVQLHAETAKIGLIATAPKYQGMGLGKKILTFAENYALQNGAKQMQIPTQKENAAACAFYQKMGYSTAEQQIIKHFWKI